MGYAQGLFGLGEVNIFRYDCIVIVVRVLQGCVQFLVIVFREDLCVVFFLMFIFFLVLIQFVSQGYCYRWYCCFVIQLIFLFLLYLQGTELDSNIGLYFRFLGDTIYLFFIDSGIELFIFFNRYFVFIEVSLKVEFVMFLCLKLRNQV